MHYHRHEVHDEISKRQKIYYPDQFLVRETPFDEVSASTIGNLNNVYAITWDWVQTATLSEYEDLIYLIQRGFPELKTDLDSKFSAFWNFLRGLHGYDNAILYLNRVLIPPSLHSEVLDSSLQ